MLASKAQMITALMLLMAFSAAPEKEALKLGQDAPYFMLRTMNPQNAGQKRFVLRNLVGDRATEKKKAVVLSFAASYCVPCRGELKELPSLKDELKKAGVELAVVVIDTEKEGIEAMRKLTVDELKLPYPVLADRFSVVARRYRATTLPMMVIIDDGGKVKWLSSGFKEDTLAKLKAQLGI